MRDVVLMGTAHTLSPFASPGKPQERIAEEALRTLGIETLSDRPFDTLSGGEQQLVLIARALAQQVKILLMDEPTSSLDYGNQIRVLSAVKRLSEDGYTVLLSTHNPQHAMWYADRALALLSGRVEALGPVREILTPALLQTLYGVKTDIMDTSGGPAILPVIKEKGEGI